MKRILLFDIDGTLLRTGGAGSIAIEQVFVERYNIPNAWGKTLAYGKTDPGIIEEIYLRHHERKPSAKELREVLDRYVELFEHEIQNAKKFHVLPGVVDLLATLDAREDIVLGLETGNVEPAAWLKLKRGSIAQHFKFGGFGSDSAERKEIIAAAFRRAVEHTGNVKLSPENFLVIGDAPQDINAAKENGMKVVAVMTGIHSREELEEHKPDHIFSDLSDVEKFLALL